MNAISSVVSDTCVNVAKDFCFFDQDVWSLLCQSASSLVVVRLLSALSCPRYLFNRRWREVLNAFGQNEDTNKSVRQTLSKHVQEQNDRIRHFEEHLSGQAIRQQLLRLD